MQTGAPPCAGIVQMRRRPLCKLQYAIRSPCGDQLGWTASDFKFNNCLLPVATSITARSAAHIRTSGSSNGKVEHTILSPFGDHAGKYPVSETRFTDSPVAPMT